MSSDRGRGRGRGQGDRGGRGGPGGRGRGDFQVPYHSRGGRGGGGPPGDRGRGAGSRGGRGGFGASQDKEVRVYTPESPQALVHDPVIKKIEDDTEKAIQAFRKSGSGYDPNMPLRPGFGTQGKQIMLWANYFKLLSEGDLVLYRYSLEVKAPAKKPEPKGKKLRRLVQLLLTEHLSKSGSSQATDFKTTLISKNKLENDLQVYDIPYKVEGEDEPAEDAPVYRIKVQYTNSLTYSALLDHLKSTNPSSNFDDAQNLIQALNIIVGHTPKASANVASVGQNKHFSINAASSDVWDLGAGLKAIRGYFVSVRAATARILVNVQVKHGAFYLDGRLEDVIKQAGPNNMYTKRKLAIFLRKVSVDTKHIRKKNKAGNFIPRIKTIYGLATKLDGRKQPHPPQVSDFGAGPKDVSFWLDESGGRPAGKSSGSGGKKGKAPASGGRYITVYEHFKKNYQIDANPSFPVINVGTTDLPSYLPAEVCEVIPGQAAAQALSPNQTQEMIRFAVRKPHANANSIVTTGTSLLGFSPPSGILKGFGANIPPNLLVVPGRVLRGPNVNYAGGKSANTKFGSWNMIQIKFSAPTKLTNWAYLRIKTSSGRNPVVSFTDFLAEFTVKLREVGVEASNHGGGLEITANNESVEREVDKALTRFTKTAGKKPPTLLVVFLPVNESGFYNAVKFMCDVKYGISNVCVCEPGKMWNRSLDPMTLANIALKVNLKLGGRNQSLDPSKLGLISEGKTMIVGIDVTHPSPGSKKAAPSVAAIVASVDKHAAQWPAALHVQEARKEMVSGLKELVKSRLRLWQKHNRNFLPENILVYRDGVSEGQYKLVLEQELPAIQQACEELQSGKGQAKIKITIVVVGKRHNTRFYPTKVEDADRSSNPVNGTVVDRGVTEARNWDFFLQAHTALQGTARPAHYYIVWDEIFQRQKPKPPFNSAADVLEDLTHNLCYMYGRATKAVSICPPAYYADLACERARRYLASVFAPSDTGSVYSEDSQGRADQSMVEPHQNIKDTMFYI